MFLCSRGDVHQRIANQVHAKKADPPSATSMTNFLVWVRQLSFVPQLIASHRHLFELALESEASPDIVSLKLGKASTSFAHDSEEIAMSGALLQQYFKVLLLLPIK